MLNDLWGTHLASTQDLDSGCIYGSAKLSKWDTGG